MRILIINTDYPAFLRQHYGRNPELKDKSFDEQLAARNASFFGVFDAYSKAFESHGHHAIEVHANNGLLQRCYMVERGHPPPPVPPPSKSRLVRKASSVSARIMNLMMNRIPFLRFYRPTLTSPFGIAPWRLSDILVSQVEEFRPDVILNQSVSEIRSELLLRLKPYTKLIVGQIASPLPEREDYRAYDLMISSLPNFVEYYRNRGIRSELNRLGFDRRVLETIGSPPRDVDVTFVGSLSPAHPERAQLISWLAEQTRLDIWGNGVKQFPAKSPINLHYHGEVWGADMFRVLARSKITINNHIGIAGNYANNMRLYEATGMGCLLITDKKANIAEIFEPGREIVCYSSKEECLELIRYYSTHEAERSAIAAAGQRRALEEHSYIARTSELARLFESCLAGAEQPGRRIVKADARHGETAFPHGSGSR
ncbi:glycosyltransferase [Bradyrhizobium sp. ISRA442]|uniref:CgeB family protein n=1 Tax=Bradyrhizobium sp. ISRA442 TaxID=2866197 RepID=UPI00311B01DE